jgi:hypothetical protein
MLNIIRIPSICRTRLGFAVFRVKNILDDNFPKREPLREGVSSKSAISKSAIYFFQPIKTFILTDYFDLKKKERIFFSLLCCCYKRRKRNVLQ